MCENKSVTVWGSNGFTLIPLAAICICCDAIRYSVSTPFLEK